MISPQQLRMLHAVARSAGYGHEGIRDEANIIYGVESLKDLTTEQASALIAYYLSQAEPPAPPERPTPPRFHLPKRVEKPAPKPLSLIQGFMKPVPVVVAPPSPITPPRAPPAYSKPHRALTPDGKLSCGNSEVDQIPW